MLPAIIFFYFCVCAFAFIVSFYWISKTFIFDDNIIRIAIVESVAIAFYSIAFTILYQGFLEFLLLNSGNLSWIM